MDTVCCKGDEVLLAVEIHSPSTRAYDLALKRQLYQDAAVPYLLMVDPAPGVPVAVLLRLVDGEYRDFAVSVDGRLTFSEPFGVDLAL
jgi:Uma2 family endonuclease